MNKKLIERARKAHTSLGESLHFGLCAELADRIEELEKQLAAARQQVKLLRDKVDWLRRYGCKDDLAFRVAQDALIATDPKP